MGVCAHGRCPGWAAGAGLLLAEAGSPPASSPLAREQGWLGWVWKAPCPQAGPPGIMPLSPRAEGPAGGAAGRVGRQAHTAHPWRHETQAWPTSHLLPTARGWHTPGFHGLAAMPPAITWPQEGAAPGRPLGHKPRPAWPRFPAGHRGRCWPLASRDTVASLARAVARAGAPQRPAAAAQHGQHGQRGAHRWREASPGIREPRRAGARSEGRAVGAGPGTLHPCACAGVSRCLRGLGWRWLSGPG